MTTNGVNDDVCAQARLTAILGCRYGPHEKSWKSGGVFLIWNPGQVLTAGCVESPGKARLFISDQPKVFQDRERRPKLHRCIQTAICSARGDSRSTRRDSRLFFQTFRPSFVVSWRISANDPSLESLRSQQNDGAIFVPTSPKEQTIAPFLRRVLTLSAQFPRIRTCSGQINLYKGEIAVLWSLRQSFSLHWTLCFDSWKQLVTRDARETSKYRQSNTERWGQNKIRAETNPDFNESES